MKRGKTDVPGLFYRERPIRKKSKTTERVWYGRYTSPISSVQREVTLGREDSEGITLHNAAGLLGDYLSGKLTHKSDLKLEREKEKQKRLTNTFEGLCEQYFKHVDKNGICHKDKSIYKSDFGNLKNHILPVIGHLDPSKITVAELKKVRERAYSYQINKPNVPLPKKKKRSPQTVKHILGLVRRVLYFAEIEHISKKQWKDLIPDVHVKVDEDLTDNELSSLLEVLRTADNKPVADMMLLILNTGMRQGEVIKLKWKHVDFEKRTIFLKDPKGKVSFKIPMNAHAESILQRQKKTKNPYVFPGDHNGRKGSISKPARYIADLAGLPYSFRPCHGLRHFFLTKLVSNGVDIETIRNFAGHKDIRTTQRYNAPQEESMKNAADIMGGVINEAL